MTHAYYETFLNAHQLPCSYIDNALRAYQPLIDDILCRLKSKQPIVLGINGCQGSGKSTCAAFLETTLTKQHALNVVNISLDDFYLSKASRQQKAKTIHPLFATRGVPGTHDIVLALKTLRAMINGESPAISRFDKAIDDLKPKNDWDIAPKHIDVIILEGWFISARPQAEHTLIEPINQLESKEDTQGIWRRHVNEQLKGDYQILFSFIDCLVMLKAPSFDTVFQWRLEQETKLAKKLQTTLQASSSNTGLMNETEIKRFVAFFQRLTQSMLEEMPERADHCYVLNTERQIIHEQHKHTDKTNSGADIHRP